MGADWIMAIIELCRAAAGAGRTLQAIRASQLGHRERELLRMAADDGEFTVLHTPGTGRFVETSTKRFTADDPAITAHYLDAFMRLCDQGLVIHQNGCVFRLTGQGFDIARKLRDGKNSD